MTSRKRIHKMEKASQKNYKAQSPKDNNDESIDDLLSNVDEFIQGVYRDLSIGSPESSLTVRGASLCARKSMPNYSSASSSNTSPTAVSSTASENVCLSKTSRRSLDAEIEKINRMCDNVNENLRSIGLFMNNSNGSNLSDDFLNANLSSSPSSSTTSVTAQFLTPAVRPQSFLSHNPSAEESADQVIDLSESQVRTPEVHIQLQQSNDHISVDDDDDEVILVSDNINPVVDLCTPGSNSQEVPYRRRASVDQRQLNRRRLNHDDIECVGFSTPRKRYTHLPALRKSFCDNDLDSSDSLTSLTAGTSSHTPFMCPVCMESCLQRQPTSTRCGHVFCKHCIEHAIRLTHKCPLCNARTSKSQIFRIYL